MFRILSEKNTKSFLCYSFILLCLLLLIYGDIFLLGKNLLYSSPDVDLVISYFNIHFTFSQIHQGIFPLWCPNLMAGYPYFATFQTQLLYPFAWIWYFLPLTTGTNIFFIFHLFLLGMGTLCWIWPKTKHPLSAFLAAALITFGAYAPSLIYNGHLTPIATVAWVPWILFCVDNLINQSKRWYWFLLLILLLALQLAGGFPQHYFYTFLCVFLYSSGILLSKKDIGYKLTVLLGGEIFFAYFYSCLLLALQLLVSQDARAATDRLHALPASYLGLYSFSPYSLITTIVPFFYGDNRQVYYWGPWIFAASPCYYGIAALTFVIVYLFTSAEKKKWGYLGIALFFMAISFGSYLPTFSLTSQLPFFNNFRCSSRALFYAQLFGVAMAALGVDQLLSNKINRKAFVAVITFLFSIIACLLLLYLCLNNIESSASLSALWRKFVIQAGYPYFSHGLEVHLRRFMETAPFAKEQIYLTFLPLLVFAILYYLGRNRRIVAYVLVILSVFEVLLFSINIRRGFPIDITQKKSLAHFLQQHPGNQRFLKTPLDNWAQSLPQSTSGGDINGYESFRLQRYDAFINYSLGRNIYTAQDVFFCDRYSPLLRILRCRYHFFVRSDREHFRVTEEPNSLPHLLLLNQWNIIPSKKNVLSTIGSNKFNPMKQAVLETPPVFYPAKTSATSKSQVTLLRSSSNWLDIKATTSKKAILLVTDAYAKGWKVFPYKDSSQQKYDVMPADFIVRGIPLSPGTHHFRLEYAPDAFYRGRIISLATLVFYILGWCALLAVTLKRLKNKQ